MRLILRGSSLWEGRSSTSRGRLSRSAQRKSSWSTEGKPGLRQAEQVAEEKAHLILRAFGRRLASELFAGLSRPSPDEA
jgi:hypothetical protein